MKETGSRARQPFPGRWSDQVNTAPTGMHETGQVNTSEREHGEPEEKTAASTEKGHGRRKKRGGLALIVLLAGVFLGSGFLFGTIWDSVTRIGGFDYSGDGRQAEQETREEPQTEYVNPAEQMTVTASDINFSQSEDPEKAGVYVLMRVRNDNEEAVNGMLFLVSCGDRILTNDDNGGDYFKASGYIPAHEEGYMCALIKTAGSDGCQGEIVPVEGYECDTREDYLQPAGIIAGFDKKRDAYHVKIVNRSGRAVMAGRARVVAVEEGCTGLAGSWGAGELEEDIADGQTRLLKGVIVNPGLKNRETGKFQVFLVDM